MTAVTSVIVGSVVAVSGLLTVGLCRGAAAGDRDDPPPAEHQPALAGEEQPS